MGCLFISNIRALIGASLCVTTGRGKGLFAALKFFSYLLHRVVVGGLECALRRAGKCGHLVVGHLIVVAQAEDELLLGRQAEQSTL